MLKDHLDSPVTRRRLRAGPAAPYVDVRTTEAYLRVDPTEKLEAVEAVLPIALRRGRFKAPDALIASLRALG
jgi:hypothetical protein